MGCTHMRTAARLRHGDLAPVAGCDFWQNVRSWVAIPK